MKKLASVVVIGLVTLLMSSCFMFRTHEDCPAYGTNIEKKEVKEDIELDKDALLISQENKI